MAATAARAEKLFIGIELSKKNWRLAFSNGQQIRQRTLAAGDQELLRQELARAKQKLGLAAGAAVDSCYETGRDGFWVHRLLESLGVHNVVVDAASIETPRRFRRAKTDRLDAEMLVRKLIAWERGDRLVWRVARVPTVAAEDERRPQRELERLKRERTAHRARIASLLALQGVAVRLRANQQLAVALERLRDWHGQPLPPQSLEELQRELARLTVVHEQIRGLEAQQQAAGQRPQGPTPQVAVKLMRLRGVGPVGAWLLACEFFGWRQFRNRREVGALAGLCGSPYASGETAREQGISKAGNRRVRWVMIELAWSWLQFQPDSRLTHWFWERFGRGSARMRRIGIVAVARKLLVALWQYLDHDQWPEGAVAKSGTTRAPVAAAAR